MDDKDKRILELEARVKELENDLIHDQLTGLKTRQYLIQRAEAVFGSQVNDERRRDRYWASVLFCDIDNFKQINDRYGHAVGDEVLKKVAWTIKKCLRRIDVIARWGGEEIVVWMAGDSDGPQPDPLAKAEQIRQAVAGIRLESEPKIEVTISVGVARTSSAERVTIEDLIKQADQAMYQAKEAGKNQVAVAD